MSPLSLVLSFLLLRRPPCSSLFPYTTLFRSLFLFSVDRFLNRRSHFVCQLADHRPFFFGQFAHSSKNLCDRSFPDRKSTRLNSSHVSISYAVFCLKKKKIIVVTQSLVTSIQI